MIPGTVVTLPYTVIPFCVVWLRRDICVADAFQLRETFIYLVDVTDTCHHIDDVLPAQNRHCCAADMLDCADSVPKNSANEFLFLSVECWPLWIIINNDYWVVVQTQFPIIEFTSRT